MATKVTMQTEYDPTWMSPPGDTILDALEERGWTQAALAERTGFTRKHVNDLIKARVAITPEAALRLEATIGSPAAFWLRRDALYRERLQRLAEERALVAQAAWLDELPLSFMVKQGWVTRHRDKGQQVAKCLRYFGVASVDAWRNRYEVPLAVFRSSPSYERKVGAVAAWLRQGEIQATAQRLGDYHGRGFLRVLAEVRQLTTEPEPSVFEPRLKALCAEHGIAVCFVPAPPGCPVSGATRWLGQNRAMIVLSLRHKTNDHLWFTFFHEAGHLLRHSKKQVFVEWERGQAGEQEAEADTFARDILIAPSAFARLQGMDPTRESVRVFADEIGIAPGIVVGRLQHDKLLPYSHLNDLKVRYEWRAQDVTGCDPSEP